MVFLFCALYHEASPLISHYHLKREDSFSLFQVFHGGDIVLAVTGVGKHAASVCVSHMLTRYCPSNRLGTDDVVISYGSAGGIGFDVGEVYGISRILDEESGRWFYPDLHAHADIPMAPLVTSGAPVSLPDAPVSAGGFLYDMEGSAIFAAASYFAGPHQIHLWKVVSDALHPEQIDLEAFRNHMLNGAKPLIAWIDAHIDSTSTKVTAPAEDTTIYERLCQELHLSRYQSIELSHLLHFCTLSNLPIQPVVDALYDEALLPAPNKRKGSMVFEILKSRLLQSFS
ncbi:MAG: hypothetical protein K6G04_06620 [Lachnospiraceae bacterium]|nr:hypothetical protein [Lachnospiraceae bacterium]